MLKINDQAHMVMTITMMTMLMIMWYDSPFETVYQPIYLGNERKIMKGSRRWVTFCSQMNSPELGSESGGQDRLKSMCFLLCIWSWRKFILQLSFMCLNYFFIVNLFWIFCLHWPLTIPQVFSISWLMSNPHNKCIYFLFLCKITTNIISLELIKV